LEEKYTGILRGNLEEVEPAGTARLEVGGEYKHKWVTVNWINLTQGRKKWRTLVNAVMNCRFT
jgi:hypothetical protein